MNVQFIYRMCCNEWQSVTSDDRLTDDIHAVFVYNATRQQVKVVLLVTNNNGVSGIVSALNKFQALFTLKSNTHYTVTVVYHKINVKY